MPCKTHIAHIAHIAGAYSTKNTYSMELGESQRIVQRPVIRDTGACLLRAQPTTRTIVASPPLWHTAPWARKAALLKDAQLGNALQYDQGPQTLRHGDRLVGPNFRFSRTESLTHCTVTSTRMQRFSTARVSASKTLSSGRARHSNPSA